ncbi:MAG: ATP-binding cassette domain-containing protein [Bdellovibrionales bacterium]
MIHLKDLKKVFPANVVAVENMNLDIDSGTITCLIGPSGCGKTTTLKMINRIIEPSFGNIEINKLNIFKTNPVEWRKKIGYVIQKIGLFPHLTILENISILSKVLKKDSQWIKERTDYLLNLVGLNPKQYCQRYPMELSGGQQQRVGIARALMEDPPVLLMDEPFGSLDILNRSSLREEFLHLNQKLKKTILLVTHDLDEAFEMGDQIVLMKKGRIIQKGSKSDFKNKPSSKFVEDFLK